MLEQLLWMSALTQELLVMALIGAQGLLSSALLLAWLGLQWLLLRGPRQLQWRQM
jgi:hypothetical protein